MSSQIWCQPKNQSCSECAETWSQEIFREKKFGVHKKVAQNVLKHALFFEFLKSDDVSI